MATSKQYLNFILKQLSDIEGITYKQMMGEELPKGKRGKNNEMLWSIRF